MPIPSRNITALNWRRGSASNGTKAKSKCTKMILMFGVPLLAVAGTIMNVYFLPLNELGLGESDGTRMMSSSQLPESKATVSGKSWCDHVKEARANLMPSLHIKYVCDGMMPATSAVVCMLTDGSSSEKASRIVFTARDYINGAMALGTSLQRNIDPLKTHQLLLLREGFTLDDDDKIRLQSAGWTLGTAPNYKLRPKYIPRFPRYKTTYTKVTAIGLSEYRCVMLMDADTLAVGDLRGVMSDCDKSVFRHPANRVGGVLDLYRGQWKLFNTGSILWKTSSEEMERVFHLSQDDSWMKKFSSDQAFLNAVYSEREHNLTLNAEIVALDTPESRKLSNGQIGPVVPHKLAQQGAVVPLSWDYNAQTHVEVQRPAWWEMKRSTVKVLHFTEKKGWQCNQTLDPPPQMTDEGKEKCKKDKNAPFCYCLEAHLYWNALEEANGAARKKLEASKLYQKK